MMRRNFSTSIIMIVSIIFGLFFSSVSIASEYQKAVDATRSENYDQAISIWLKLAKQGNPIAQYNLAVFYREGYGTDSDRTESKRWFKAAAQQGLIQAANQFDKNIIKPVDDDDIQKLVAEQRDVNFSDNDPVGWVLKQNPQFYTLQLASSKNEENIKQYYEENNMQGKGGYYKSERDGEIWYYLIYGAYSSTAKASSEIEQLPEEIRKWSPWVRQLGNIQKVVNR